jgi:hypothetical protein
MDILGVISVDNQKSYPERNEWIKTIIAVNSKRASMEGVLRVKEGYPACVMCFKTRIGVT